MFIHANTLNIIYRTSHLHFKCTVHTSKTKNKRAVRQLILIVYHSLVAMNIISMMSGAISNHEIQEVVQFSCRVGL